ncbi:uncharacterized protein [Henckelia pumila]|uniref:uncharacterized protein n=1 Tax=Henckelia pumila TaxID=405737 RepID=UPI003C6E3C5E
MYVCMCEQELWGNKSLPNSSKLTQSHLHTPAPKRWIFVPTIALLPSPLGKKKIKEKKTHLHHQLHYLSHAIMFLFFALPDMCGLFRPLHWSEFFTEKTGESEERAFPPSPLSIFSLFLSFLHLYYSYLFLYLLIYKPPFFIACQPFLFFLFIIPIAIYSFSCFHLYLFVTRLADLSVVLLICRLIIFKITFFFRKGACVLIWDLMSRKSNDVVLGHTPFYGVGASEDAKSRFRHQALIQDYQELRREAIVMRSKLEAAKQRKMMLAGEVRFLRGRYELLMKTKAMNSSLETKHVQSPNPHKRTKIVKEATVHRLPPITEQKPKKKHNFRKEAALRGASTVIDRHNHDILHLGNEAGQALSNTVSGMNHKRRKNSGKDVLSQNTSTILDRNLKARIHGTNEAALRNSSTTFDLNLDSSLSGKEPSLPSRAPIFDLNEISTGDEEFQFNADAAMFEEAKKSLVRGNDEQQTDLKLSICRNAGESSSHVGKRKISWKDPVALRV